MNAGQWVPPTIFVGYSGSDPGWKIVGFGDFGTTSTNPQKDGKLDILWRHEALDLIGIWFMNASTVTDMGGSIPI